MGSGFIGYPLSVFPCFFNANDIKVLSAPAKFATFVVLWRAAEKRAYSSLPDVLHRRQLLKPHVMVHHRSN